VAVMGRTEWRGSDGGEGLMCLERRHTYECAEVQTEAR
jgi:hypothetical protein